MFKSEPNQNISIMKHVNHKTNRPPKPPVPKFHQIGAGTDTPDFLPPANSEEDVSSTTGGVHLLSQPEQIVSALSQSDNCANRKRIQAIIDEICHQIIKLENLLQENSRKIETSAIQLLNEPLLDQMKSKKYSAIAAGCIFFAITKHQLPITMKQVVDNQEKQVKKVIKLLLRSEVDQMKAMVVSFIKRICSKLYLNDKFIEMCLTMMTLMEKRNLIGGEHENVIAATIVKVVGDIIFFAKGGIVLNFIVEGANCCEYSVKAMLKKVQNYIQPLSQELANVWVQQ